jgi:hypothetical protein
MIDEDINYEDMDDLPLSDHIEWHHFTAETKGNNHDASEPDWFAV